MPHNPTVLTETSSSAKSSRSQSSIPTPLHYHHHAADRLMLDTVSFTPAETGHMSVKKSPFQLSTPQNVTVIPKKSHFKNVKSVNTNRNPEAVQILFNSMISYSLSKSVPVNFNKSSTREIGLLGARRTIHSSLLGALQVDLFMDLCSGNKRSI